MKNSWKFFAIVELILLMMVFMQLAHSTPLMIFLALAMINLIYATRKKQRTNFNQFQIIISMVLISLCLLTSPFIWAMIILAVLFIGIKGIEASGLRFFEQAPWKKKQMIIVEVSESEAKNGRRFRRPWIGNERIGSNIYEWDDINFSIISGDTIIDLGNTLLPKEDNVIMVRKGFGRTRILIPFGIGIMLEHSSLRGQAIFEGQRYVLRNESIKLYSDDFDENQRRIKIVTSTLMGEIEVIRV